MAIADYKIDKEFKNLVPPLTDEERQGLEDSIVAERRILMPLAIWKGQGIVLDGMNRKFLADKHGLGYKTVEIDLPDRDSAKLWILKNSLNRRNLSDFSRGVVALAAKDIIAKQAEAREKAGKKALNPSPNSDEGRTDVAVANIAGLGKESIRKIESVVEDASPAIINMAHKGEVSIDAAAHVSTLTEKQQDKLAKQGPAAVKEAAKEIREEAKAAKKAPATKTDNKSEPKDAKKKEPELVTEDDLGRKIKEDDIIQAFSARAALRSMMNEVSAFKGRFEELIKGPLGAYAHGQDKQFYAAIGSARGVLRFLQPYAICPSCGGRKCDGCKRSGWMPKDVYDRVVPEKK